MSSSHTRWTLIERAAAGNPADREAFAHRYAPVIRSYLRARWHNRPLAGEIDDAVQQVFVDCFKPDGALGRADAAHAGGFRAFLYGVVRNVARGIERARATAPGQPADSVTIDALPSDDESLARVFDRAWAATVLRDAAALQLEHARKKGDAAIRRHELLGLRHGEELPIREIAARWDVDPAWLHGQYRQAREEFRRALEEVVRGQHGGGPQAVEAECRQLLEHFR